MSAPLSSVAETNLSLYQQMIEAPTTPCIVVIVVGGVVAALSSMHSIALAVAVIAISAIACGVIIYLAWKADQDDAAQKATPLITPNMCDWLKVTIVNQLGNLAPEERADFVTDALLFITPELDDNEKADFMEEFGSLTHKERAEFVELALSFITPGMELYKPEIIEIYRTLTLEEARCFNEQLCHLISSDLHDCQRGDRIIYFGHLKSVERATLVKQLSLLGLDNLISSRVVSYFLFMPSAAERVEAVSLLLRLITSVEDMSEKLPIIQDFLWKISPLERMVTVEWIETQLQVELRQNPDLNIAARTLELLQTHE